MKYFIDTEFIEGFHKPLFGKKRHFIDLISIGIKAEDGREYYAISSEFNPKDAGQWVLENVISKLPSKHFNGSNANEANLYKSSTRIAKEVEQFVLTNTATCDKGAACCLIREPNNADFKSEGHHKLTNIYNSEHEFYAYYAEYDWVLFCSLFGLMIDLPKEFPMYCKDLKQIQDEFIETLPMSQGSKDIRNMERYPIQVNEHNALEDAKWNFELYKFIKFENDRNKI